MSDGTSGGGASPIYDPLLRRALAYASSLADDYGQPSITAPHILCGAVRADPLLQERFLSAGISLDCLMELVRLMPPQPLPPRVTGPEVSSVREEALASSQGRLYGLLRELADRDPQVVELLRRCTGSVSTSEEFKELVPPIETEVWEAENPAIRAQLRHVSPHRPVEWER